jgi:putative transcription factor
MLVSEKLELVDDFAERIRRAREALGWDQKTLALKLKVSENIVKRLESGKLRPPIDLAKKIEEILNIKILVPAVDEMVSSRGKVEKYVTFGEIVSIRGAEEE